VSEALKVELQHFANCIENGTTPLTDGIAGLQVVRILESASLSMRQRGKLIELESNQFNVYSGAA
jgi:predicted dehydrogenase